ERVGVGEAGACRRMLGVIVEHGLTRFSSAARAIDVWYGFAFAAGDVRRLSSLLERTIVLLDDRAARDDAIRAGSGEDAYLGMWSVAYEDAFLAIPIAETLLADPDPQRRYAAAHLLAELNIGTAAHALVNA